MVACPAFYSKIFLFAINPNQIHIYAVLPHRGAYSRFVTNAGRDAVDADGAQTKAPEADGEVVWS